MNILKNLDKLSELNINKIEDNNLYLLKYDKEKSDFTKNAVNESRGIILEKNTNKVICYSLNKTEKNLEIDKINWNNCKIYEVFDGTQIRLYYYNNKWIVTTARCINANKSKWNYMKTFYDLYKDVQINTDKLDKNNTYTFILRHVENRIISNIKENQLIHIHTRNNRTFEEINEKIEGIKTKEEIYFENYEDFNKELKNGSYDTRGYIIHYDNKKYLFETDEYKYVKKLKNNHRNIIYEYLELIQKKKYYEYLEYFPEKEILFKNVENQLNELTNIIHNYYIKKNITKEIKFTDIPIYLRKLLFNLHNIFITKKTIITKEIIYFYLLEQSPGFIISLVKNNSISQK